MNIRNLALIFSCAAVVAIGGASATACSSSSGGNSSSSGAHDSGTTSSSSSGSSSGGGTTDSGCKSDPSIHAAEAGAIYCGFDDAGAGFSCPTGQECCLGGKQGSGYAPEQCATWGSTCTNGTDPIPMECQQSSDCTANGASGAVCCIQGNPSAPAAVAGCDPANLKSSGGTAVMCEGAGSGSGGGDAGTGSGDAGGGGGGGSGACASGELQVCQSSSECAGGKTCTPIRWKIYEIGVCL